MMRAKKCGGFTWPTSHHCGAKEALVYGRAPHRADGGRVRRGFEGAAGVTPEDRILKENRFL